MQDRVPTYPGRVTMTPVAGQANTYDMARADQPTQEGTPLNKDSLLKDATAALFQLGTDAVPNDVLSVLSKATLWDGADLKTPNGEVVSRLKFGNSSYYGNGTNTTSFSVQGDPVIGFILPYEDNERTENGIFLFDGSFYRILLPLTDGDSRTSLFSCTLSGSTMTFTHRWSSYLAYFGLNESGKQYMVSFLYK